MFHSIFKVKNIFSNSKLFYSNQSQEIILSQIFYLNQQYHNLTVNIKTYNLYYDDPMVKKELEYIRDKIQQIKYDFRFEKKNVGFLLYHIDITKEKCYELNKKIFYYL